MMRLGGIMAVVTTAPATLSWAQEEVIDLPSGLKARLFEVLTDRPGEGLFYRFRFVADGFRPEGKDMDTIMTDLEFLCATYALERVSEVGPQPNQIVISLADREVAFGEVNPAAKQVFEAFSVENDTCIWEMF